MTTPHTTVRAIDEMTAYLEKDGSWTVEMIGTVDSERATITLKGVNFELVSEMGEPIKLRGIVNENRSSGITF